MRSCNDGRWDVWSRRMDWPDAESYKCSFAYAVDTNADGRPDWHFMTSMDEVEYVREKIAQRRAR